MPFILCFSLPFPWFHSWETYLYNKSSSQYFKLDRWNAFKLRKKFNISFQDAALTNLNKDISTPAKFSNLIQRDWFLHRLYEESGEHFANYEATKTAVPEIVSTASGIVLEIGPGTGSQLPRYQVNSIERIYGIESNPAFINVVSSKIEETSLKDK